MHLCTYGWAFSNLQLCQYCCLGFSYIRDRSVYGTHRRRDHVHEGLGLQNLFSRVHICVLQGSGAYRCAYYKMFSIFHQDASYSESHQRRRITAIHALSPDEHHRLAFYHIHSSLEKRASKKAMPDNAISTRLSDMQMVSAGFVTIFWLLWFP